MFEDLRIYADRVDYADAVNFYISLQNGTKAVKAFTIEEVEIEEGYVLPQAATLNIRTSQQLFMALWEAGFRPPQQQNLDTTIQAKNEHLRFAEAIVNNLLEIK